MLMADVPGLGIEGDVVKVADGYARNYLLPRKLAAPITDMARRQLDKRRAERASRLLRERDDAVAMIAALQQVSLTLPMKAGPDGKLYGSVTTADLAAALAAQKLAVDRRHIVLDKPLRELGVFEVPIRLHPEAQTTLKVWVVEE